MSMRRVTKRMMGVALTVGGALALYLLLVIAVNFWYTPPVVRNLKWQGGTRAMRTPELGLVIWNLGYAGMGKESNFVVDGGTDWLPPSRQIVEKNLQGISGFLRRRNPDLYLLQEVAQPSLMSRGVDVLRPVSAELPGYQHVYTPDFRTRLIPPPLSVNIGLAVFARRELKVKSRAHLLPLEPRRMVLFRKQYQFVVNRIAVEGLSGQWVIVNIHLAAFDDQAEIRSRQLDVLRDFASHEFHQGNYVVIGGDWNLKLAETDFPHNTDEKYLFWVHNLPKDAFPDEWQIVADTRTPSVRTDHQAYSPGDNYVCVIDGFVASPNVRVESVTTADLGFEFSDHHPVEARFVAQVGNR